MPPPPGDSPTAALSPAPPARLARALRSARIAFFDFRPADPRRNAGEVWHWSGAQFGITGVDGEDGRACLLRAATEADRPSLHQVLHLGAGEFSGSTEFRATAPNGGIIYLQCEAYAEPDRSGAGGAIFGVVRDVSHERYFEAELTEIVRRNQVLLATIDACPLSITVADARLPDMPLIYANRRFRQITGYEQAEVIGRNCRFLQGPATEDDATAAIRRALAAGEQAELTLNNYTKAGEVFLNRLILAPVHDETGSLTAYIGLQADITLDAKRRDAEAQRQKMEALGRMMGGVAHEVNNMLQPITLLAQHIIDQALITEDGRPLLDVVLDCGQKARQIIGDLLAFSRPATRSAEIHEPVKLLHESLRLVRQAIPPGVTLTVRTEGTPRPISITRTIFVQIILNLATNAAAAMDGQGELTMTLKDQGDGAGIELSVIDTGCGMDRITLDRAFEPFFTTKPVGQGTGLGLPMVYGLIREAGGSIVLDSEPGHGTTATILLPPSPGDRHNGIHPDH
jgi:PAS domain S-box-containing protein